MSFYAYMLRCRATAPTTLVTLTTWKPDSSSTETVSFRATPAQHVLFDSFGARAFAQEMRPSLTNGESRAGPESRRKR